MLVFFEGDDDGQRLTFLLQDERLLQIRNSGAVGGCSFRNREHLCHRFVILGKQQTEVRVGIIRHGHSIPPDCEYRT